MIQEETSGVPHLLRILDALDIAPLRAPTLELSVFDADTVNTIYDQAMTRATNRY